MNLILTIVTCPAGCNMEGQQHLFGAEGGTFGRAPDNSWVLPDPSRYVSSQHGQIVFQQQQFVLLDKSTNGIYLNEAPHPLGATSRTVLKQGDRLQFGDYRLQVAVESVVDAAQTMIGDSFGLAAKPTLRSAKISSATPSVDDLDKWLEPVQSVAAPTPKVGPNLNTKLWPNEPPISPLDLGLREETDPLAALGGANVATSPAQMNRKQVDLSDLIQATPPLDQQMMKIPTAIPNDWDDLLGLGSNEAVAPAPDLPAELTAPGSSVRQPITPPTAEKPAQVQPLSDVGSVNEVEPKSPLAATTANGTAEDLASALGLQRLNPEQLQKLNSLVAEIVRETVAGMMQALRARSEIKSEFRLNMTTIQAVENNPLKFSVTVDDALENMFTKTGQAYLSPIEAIKDGFADIADHQLALFEAMRAGYDHILGQFDPQALERKFERTMGQGLLKTVRKGKNWDAFKATYDEYKLDNEATFRRLFGEVFAEMYERRMLSLRMRRKIKNDRS